MNTNNFRMIQKTVKCLSKIDVEIFDTAEQAIRTAITQLPTGIELAESAQDMVESLKRMQADCLYEVQAPFSIHYLVFYSSSNRQYMFGGPCLLEAINEGAFRTEMRMLHVNPSLYDRILNYCKYFPVISYESYHQLGVILAQCMLDVEQVIPYRSYQYLWNKGGSLFLTDDYAELALMRHVEQRYHLNAAMNEAVKCGNLSLAYQFMTQMRETQESMNRSQDPLRNMKNMGIVLNTQLRHALEGSNVHPYLLDRLSGEIAVRIESFTGVDEVGNMIPEIIRLYTELVQQNSYAGLSPLPHLAITYIKDHLSENLTVQDTAQVLRVNPDYLSNCFHKEMGITFIDFVNRERTIQAAALLRNTDLQIQEIANIVGYNHSSYFAKQFKRLQGITPREYRSITHTEEK